MLERAHSRPSWRGYPLLQVIRKLGQASGLKVSLDAGNAASYTSGQSWLDTSGNGYDFFLGADGSATATDPTFTGTAGQLSSGEYFLHDGGDYFTYDTTNETWMNNLHKDNAAFTFAAMVHMPGGSNSGVCGTGNGVAQHGVRFFVGSANGLSLTVYNGSGSAAALSVSNTATTNTGAWNFVAVSVDEAAGTGVFMVNGTADTFTSTYSSPSSSSATNTMQIGAVGAAGLTVPNLTRFGTFAAWEARALSASQLAALFMAIRGRFGV